MALHQVRSALVSSLESIQGISPLNYEGLKALNTTLPYGDVYFMPGIPQPMTHGSGGSDHLDGILQINLRDELAGGTSNIYTQVDTLRQTFYAGNYLTFGNTVVTIRTCGVGPLLKEGGALVAPVTISYYARLRRP